MRSESLYVSRHAVERYVERVKPCLTFDQARIELEALAQMDAELSPAPPGWKNGGVEYPDTAYSEPCPGIALALRDGLVVTVLTRAENSVEVRESKRAERRRRKRAKRLRKHAERAADHRPVSVEADWGME